MIVAFQGVAGSYAHLALQNLFPDALAKPCPTFAAALTAVEQGAAQRAVIPLENSTMGRVTDIHYLLPKTSLQVVGEYYAPIRHALLGVPGATLAEVRIAVSQEPALLQCRETLHTLGLQEQHFVDTATAAQHIAQLQDPAYAAIASELAGEIYGLTVLRRDMQDQSGNTTRFLIFAPIAAVSVPMAHIPCKTLLLFTVRSIPSALYKALGGFATNGVNLTKLESYLSGVNFEIAQFVIEIEGHPQQPATALALDELAYFSESMKILGTYPMCPLPESVAGQHLGGEVAPSTSGGD